MKPDQKFNALLRDAAFEKISVKWWRAASKHLINAPEDDFMLRDCLMGNFKSKGQKISANATLVIKQIDSLLSSPSSSWYLAQSEVWQILSELVAYLLFINKKSVLSEFHAAIALFSRAPDHAGKFLDVFAALLKDNGRTNDLWIKRLKVLPSDISKTMEYFHSKKGLMLESDNRAKQITSKKDVIDLLLWKDSYAFPKFQYAAQVKILAWLAPSSFLDVLNSLPVQIAKLVCNDEDLFADNQTLISVLLLEPPVFDEKGIWSGKHGILAIIDSAFSPLSNVGYGRRAIEQYEKDKLCASYGEIISAIAKRKDGSHLLVSYAIYLIFLYRSMGRGNGFDDLAVDTIRKILIELGALGVSIESFKSLSLANPRWRLYCLLGASFYVSLTRQPKEKLSELWKEYSSLLATFDDEIDSQINPYFEINKNLCLIPLAHILCGLEDSAVEFSRLWGALYTQRNATRYKAFNRELISPSQHLLLVGLQSVIECLNSEELEKAREIWAVVKVSNEALYCNHYSFHDDFKMWIIHNISLLPYLYQGTWQTEIKKEAQLFASDPEIALGCALKFLKNEIKLEDVTELFSNLGIDIRSMFKEYKSWIEGNPRQKKVWLKLDEFGEKLDRAPLPPGL